jgi:DNA-binding transcriptional MerR regulator
MTKLKSGYIARRLNVSPATIRHWSNEYTDFLSKRAGRPQIGQSRVYDDHDLAVMSTIAKGRDDGLTHEQIRGLLQQGEYAAVPDMPTEEETEVRQSVALVPQPEYQRALDRTKQLSAELEKAYSERDRALAQWQGDTTHLNQRINALEGELGLAKGKLEMMEAAYQAQLAERRPAVFWLRLLIAALLLGVIIGAALVLVSRLTP